MKPTKESNEKEFEELKSVLPKVKPHHILYYYECEGNAEGHNNYYGFDRFHFLVCWQGLTDQISMLCMIILVGNNYMLQHL